MRRAIGIVGLALATGLAVAMPAQAQYGGSPTTTTPTTSTSTTSTTAPEPASDRVGEVSVEQAQPGDPVTVQAPPVFAPGSPVRLVLVRARIGEGGSQVATATANTDGGSNADFTVPSVAPGVYFVVTFGTRPDGSAIRVVSVLIILPTPGTAAASTQAAGGPAGGQAPTSGSASSAGAGPAGAKVPSPGLQVAAADIPADVRALQAPAAVEEAVFVEALAANAGVSIADGKLAVARSPLPSSAEESGMTGSFAVALAAALVGGGLVTLRARRQSRS